MDGAWSRHSDRDDLGPEAVLKFGLLCRSHHVVVLPAEQLHLLTFVICLLVFLLHLRLGELLLLVLLHSICA